MRRFILTGTPGAGKTAIIRQLEIEGFSVVEEAATDLIVAAQASGIARPWADSSFIDEIVRLQRDRQIQASNEPAEVQFHDRSAICTAALALLLEYPTSSFLEEELARIRTQSIYERQVFFIRPLGFITPTEVRQISPEDAVRFEKLHEELYRAHGFELVCIERGSVAERVRAIKAAVFGNC